jgi:HlyD family secretion protein
MDKKYWWAISAVVALVLIAFLGKKMEWWGGAKGTEVAVEKALKRDIIEKVSAQGTLFSETETKISSEVSGEIIALHKQEGDWVNKGDLLIEINPSIYLTMMDQSRAQVNQMKAAVSTAKARLRQLESSNKIAMIDYNRKKGLYDKGIIAAQEFNQSESQNIQSNGELEAAKENVNASNFQLANAEAGLKQASQNLNKTKIYAPMSGTVSKQSIELGERVVGTAQMSGTELMRISDLKNMEVRVDVSENEIIKVNLNDEAEVKIESYPDITFKGIVSQKAYSSNQNSMVTDKVTNFIVRVKLDAASFDKINNGEKEKFPFRPGMTATADIITNVVKNITAVPITSITTRENEKDKKKTDEVIFVVVKNKVVKKVIKTGIQDNDYIQILEGMNDTGAVVKAPYRVISKLLKDGDEVKVVEEEKLNEKKE